ncbi:MAG: aminotransferase class IV family protein [Bacteroidetes Order II. Incertae sedis bacterium]|nr:aminotransferase class IV family protein [Bacteroidetes Order II. bacterium]
MFTVPVFSSPFIGLNGDVVSTADAKLHVTDLALLRGYGVFDFMRVVNGIPLFEDRYLARFQHSAALLGLEIPLSITALKAHIYSLIAANGHPSAGLRLVLTGGFSSDSYHPTTPNLIVLDAPYPAPKPEYYTEGVLLIAHPYVREIAEAKTLNYIVPIRALPQIRKAGAFDMLYIDPEGWITESSRSNFFLVTKTGVVVTPHDRILRGITRGVILELAQDRYPVEMRPVHIDELQTAQEAFVTSTTNGAVGVVQLDALKIGNGQVGSVTKALHQAFLAYGEAYLTQQRTKGNLLSLRESYTYGFSEALKHHV